MAIKLERRIDALESMRGKRRSLADMPDAELMTMLLRETLGVQPSTETVRTALERLEALTDLQLAVLKAGKTSLMELIVDSKLGEHHDATH